MEFIILKHHIYSEAAKEYKMNFMTSHCGAKTAGIHLPAGLCLHSVAFPLRAALQPPKPVLLPRIRYPPRFS